MNLKTKRIVIAVLGGTFLASLLFVQWMEIIRKKEEAGLIEPRAIAGANSEACVECHANESPGIVEHWSHSTHAQKEIGCYECHKAEEGDADGFQHEGSLIATVVTPRDCGNCHTKEFEEFTASHHSRAGNILHSLDNTLAEVVEGFRATETVEGEDGSQVPGASHSMFAPFGSTPENPLTVRTPVDTRTQINGLASAFTGCQQCHGSKIALQSTTPGETISVTELKPDADGKPTNQAAVAAIKRNDDGKPLYDHSRWPNTGIGRLNLDGSRGSCSACHSRHDFSPRRARQPENCGKCHLGPDHPQKEIYEESKHGVAYRDLKDHMNLDSKTWVLGEDYSAAPTCATCHLSGNKRNKGRVTHNPGERISWTNRPMVSQILDTNSHGKCVYLVKPAELEKDPTAKDIVDKAGPKRDEMKNVCFNCHAPDTVNGFYKQYDDFVLLYNEKFGKPGKAIMDALKKKDETTGQALLTATPFDEEIEWTWFYLWHHEGRRARHGASMMAPDYAHWHGMYEVAERMYMELIPQAREVVHEAEAAGKLLQAKPAKDLIEAILASPEHAWFMREKKARAAAGVPIPR